MAMPGSAGRTVALRMEGGRARSLEEIPVTPTVRLSLDVETFTCLGCGRWNLQLPCSRGKSRSLAIRPWAR